MLEVEIEALDHLVRVLDGGDAYFHAFKISAEHITIIFEKSYLRSVEGFRLLGVLFDLRAAILHDKRLNKLLTKDEEDYHLFDELNVQPLMVLKNYLQKVKAIIVDHPDVFTVIPSSQEDEEIASEPTHMESSNIAEIINNSMDTTAVPSPPKRTSSLSFHYKKLSNNLKLKRTSTKSLNSVQSSTMSNETMQTSINSLNIALPKNYEQVTVDAVKCKELKIDIESVMKNVILQFSKMFGKIAQFDAKFTITSSATEQSSSCQLARTVLKDIQFLRNAINDSLLVMIYNMFTEHSLQLLDDEMFDITDQILKV